MRVLLILLCLLSWSCPAWAVTERLVTNLSGAYADGSLRKLLLHACDDAGDDLIHFAKAKYPPFRIVLREPLVIPEDCQGRVMIRGGDQQETILDGSALPPIGQVPGDHCILNIYSHGHIVTNVTFSGNATGAGVCLFGQEVIVDQNRFGTELSGTVVPNRYGIVVSNVFAREQSAMNGSENTLQKNTIGPEGYHGIWVGADRVHIHANHIFESGKDGLWLYGRFATVQSNRIVQNNGAGIYIGPHTYGALIGGPSFTDDHNVIHSNTTGGVVFADSSQTAAVWISHNEIVNNGGPAIDLRGDGITPNDVGDADVGPNQLLNYVEHLQSIPLVPSPSGAERYWTWGLAFHASRVELYRSSVAAIDVTDTHGGSGAWVADATFDDQTFAVSPDALVLHEGDVLSPLAYEQAATDQWHTSEFGMNVRVGPDADRDGIPDAYETGDGTIASNGSAPDLADSDSDGLPDSVEDRTRNGLWDKDLGETSAYNPDSDNDGLSDWVETHGDGHYDPAFDTNPLQMDSDGDGLADQAEDLNGNGIWDAYLGESSPRLVDSDGDGFLDGEDTCPALANPGQEPWFCE